MSILFYCLHCCLMRCKHATFPFSTRECTKFSTPSIYHTVYLLYWFGSGRDECVCKIMCNAYKYAQIRKISPSTKIHRDYISLVTLDIFVLLISFFIRDVILQNIDKDKLTDWLNTTLVTFLWMLERDSLKSKCTHTTLYNYMYYHHHHHHLVYIGIR